MSIPEKRFRIAVVVLFVSLYLLPLGARPMSSPDEYRYGQIPAEMLASGDWVVPHLDGMPYFEKPVLGYWLNAASMAVLGHNAFAVRLSSALGAGLTALLVFLFVRVRGRDEEPALAAMAVLTCLLVYGIGTTAVLDSVFAAFVTAAMVATFWFLEADSSRDQRVAFAAAGLAVGLAFLTKGFVALVILGLPLLPYLLVTRSLGRFLRQIWLPLLTALVVVLPWAVAVHLRSGFWHYFFWIEHVKRFLEADSSQHIEPFWYYLPVLLVAVLGFALGEQGAEAGYHSEPWRWILPVLALVATALLSLASVRTSRFALLAVFPLFLVVLQFTLDERVLRSPGHLVARNLDRISPSTPLVGDSSAVHALCWTTGRTDVQLFQKPGEFTYGIEHTPGREFLDPDGLVRLVESSPVPVVLLVERRRWDESDQVLPRPSFRDQDRRFYLLELASAAPGEPPLPPGDGPSDQPSLRQNGVGRHQR
jgi:4-amino-4-deoxy-L-arabinose transferase-like glycosyltransferase